MDREIDTNNPNTRTDPIYETARLDREPSAMTYALPIALIVAVILGLAYFYSGPTVPNANRADTAVTKSEPSPN
jgi:hypothetical protein